MYKVTLMAAIHQHESGSDGNLFLFHHDLDNPKLPTDDDAQTIADTLAINLETDKNETLILSDFNNVNETLLDYVQMAGLPVVRQSKLRD